MAKEQKRGNREVKKPKASKPAAAAPKTALFTKGSIEPVKLPRMKK